MRMFVLRLWFIVALGLVAGIQVWAFVANVREGNGLLATLFGVLAGAFAIQIAVLLWLRRRVRRG